MAKRKPKCAVTLELIEKYNLRISRNLIDNLWGVGVTKVTLCGHTNYVPIHLLAQHKNLETAVFEAVELAKKDKKKGKK